MTTTAVVKGVLDLLFPRCCPACGCAVEDTVMICEKCLRRLPITEQSHIKGNITEDLFAQEPMFERGGCYLFFDKESSVQTMMHKLKYNEMPEVGYALGKEAAYEFLQSDFLDDGDVIIPVPLHRKRLRQRGYNQSEWIARALSEIAEIPLDTVHLTREVDNPKQAMLRERERQANVAGIFKVNHPEELYRKHILLVDDVITTGATLRACMEAMHVIRGAKISVFGLAKAR